MTTELITESAPRQRDTARTAPHLRAEGQQAQLPRVELTGPDVARQDEILTPEALDFLAALHVRFSGRRGDLLRQRQLCRERIAGGQDLDFLAETRPVREEPSWRVAPPAPGLEDRRVEITGPTDRKMTINAMNSGAKVWLADFEDANTPHFDNVVGGQANLYDAIRRTIDYTSPEGKRYELGETTPTIIVRPRGWHLTEKHLKIDREPVAAALVDFGLYFFHNAHELVRRGVGPYFYLPKLENHLEARLWNDVFEFAQDALGMPRGTVRATVLIETITAAFEMEEILFELREHSAGLNAGRWDYIFSLIKNFRTRGGRFVLPDRAQVTMTVPFMRAYTELLVRTCHRRGAHAIGGMSAFIPSKDPEVNAEVFEKVRDDKRREAWDGFDGSWVAHPGMVDTVREVFDEVLGERPHQIERQRDDVQVRAADLLRIEATPGRITEEGLRTNVAVALRYLEAWLGGRGAVGIFGLMEDAATAEISRSQIWQWIDSEAAIEDGTLITHQLVADVVAQETERLRDEVGDDAARAARVEQARELFEHVALGPDYPTFLTVPAYAYYV
ncbi:malate synthase A [Phytoactinopolyspora mesophila]|uniref:Malate synthase n=1 Tax=Phytoactinopolyspora mesophila TaxID=2650750 RepID=A0A7K3M2Y5_9ACTN|nr:malate synthase A [Phytoactinopolyspora mesophila]NDL56798.1 malate synthase A [Phytoactinopolyspora mesophila]